MSVNNPSLTTHSAVERRPRIKGPRFEERERERELLTLQIMVQDYAFREMKELLGNPPLMFVDFRPVSYGMCIITNHEVAEQISRNSKLFPWSVPKSPTLSDLLPVIGTESILTREVFDTLRQYFR